MWVHNRFVEKQAVYTQCFNGFSGKPSPPTRRFLEKDSGDDNTTEHSPFSIFRSGALSSLIKPADVPNFRKKRFVWASIRLTGSLERISQLLLDSLQIHRSLVILAWTKGAIWNTSDSPNPVVINRWRNKRFERLELFRERFNFFHSKAFCTVHSKPSILDYIPYIPHFSGCGTSALIGGNWQMTLTSWTRPRTEYQTGEGEAGVAKTPRKTSDVWESGYRDMVLHLLPQSKAPSP